MLSGVPSNIVYCHCDEGFSGRDCSTPRENIIETVIHMSVSMRKMKKKTLWRNLEQDWGTNLVVAISNFVGVPPERISLGLKKDKWISKKLFLLETSEKTEEGRLLLSGRSGAEMGRKKKKKKKKNRITIGKKEVLVVITIKCRGKMQLRAVEDQMNLRHAAGILEIFFDKQLPNDAPKPSIRLLKSSTTGVFKKPVAIKIPSLTNTGKPKNRVIKRGKAAKKADDSVGENDDEPDGDDESEQDDTKKAAMVPLRSSAKMGQKKSKAKYTTKAASISKSGGLFSSLTSSISKLVGSSKIHAPPHATCSSECSKHGICHTGRCYCHQGYQGSSCSITSRKEFLQAEQALLHNGIVKWAAGSFMIGFGVVLGVYPLYTKLMQERERRKELIRGPMFTANKRRYR